MKKQNGPARWLQSVGLYIAVFFRWALIGAVIGILGGAIGTLFHFCIKHAAAFRMANPWTLWLMPVGGLLIALMYTATKTPLGTDNVLRAVRSDEKIPALLAPLIFVSTVITQFVGGSAGREGAAIQIGGTLGYQAGRLFKLSEKDRHVLVMCGACSVFSAVFSTPITAAVFALEVISVGEFYYVALVPCVISGIVANEFSNLCGIGPEVFPAIAVPQLAAVPALLIVLLAALCGGISILFCLALHNGEKLAHAGIKNAYLRILAGSAILIGLTLLVGSRDYNGAGMAQILGAVGGRARPEAFALKMVFTVVTIATGFRGGEIVPSMFVGATLGCVFGQLLGLDPGFCAAVGLVALFCAMVNCPMASVFLGLELFGAGGLAYFALAAAVSYMLSGYYGLYGGQKLIYSKLHAEFINIYTRL
ncbi:MAG: chloride channel protein [Oscillospiraceae bacterium]|nr:chloride channel protein [Oscillospiraceae bacterium]